MQVDGKPGRAVDEQSFALPVQMQLLLCLRQVWKRPIPGFGQSQLRTGKIIWVDEQIDVPVDTRGNIPVQDGCKRGSLQGKELNVSRLQMSGYLAQSARKKKSSQGMLPKPSLDALSDACGNHMRTHRLDPRMKHRH